MFTAGNLPKMLYTLSDINRLHIIHLLGDKEASVGEIVEATGLSQPLVSHHLKILKNNALVKTRRKGPFIYYRLSALELLEVLGILSELAQGMDDSKSAWPPFQAPSWWLNRLNRRENRRVS